MKTFPDKSKKKNTSLPEKPDCILKKRGSFVEKYFSTLSRFMAKRP